MNAYLYGTKLIFEEKEIYNCSFLRFETGQNVFVEGVWASYFHHTIT